MLHGKLRRSLLFLQRCKNMKQLRQTHAQIITSGLSKDSFVLSRVMAFCSDPMHGSLNHAWHLFEMIEIRTLCIWNTMIRAFLLKGEYTKTLEVYRKMLQDGLYPDNYTLPYILKACANLQDFVTGAVVHSQALKLGFESDTFVGNTLILVYLLCGDTMAAKKSFDGILQRTAASWTVLISGHSKHGEVEVARKLFDTAPIKDIGIWGSMISGYVQNSCFKEGLLMFRLMQIEGLEPDEGILVSVLCACAQLGALDLGIWVHHYLHRISLPLTVHLGTALLDMYVKCGKLHLAQNLFDKISNRDTICWNAMISGIAMHGDGKRALELFSNMKREGYRPDGTTFLAMLTAFSHSGMVEDGLRLFNSMRTVHHFEPKVEHYGCTVDFLSRAGLFEEAKEIIERMPISSSPLERAIAWRALLSACWNHGESLFAEVAAEHLLQLEVHSGVYVLLANVYENSGRHVDATKMRDNMKDKGVPKMPGCSSIDLGGCVHEFIAGECMHQKMDEIYRILKNLNDQMATSDC